ncbi:hypothetical protein [Saccharopolyspora sp. ASAGF58]|uniref:hypothetical protein n=1 Tax=Saccharopolyspora sp. ASAGF58 TaxID=2719023 RepID=UPI00143FFFC8|nr:hypothetical protein [Saccharopolyspora sp. ASAGF58]QIZ38597.1 hypothetical protein FDZ84_33820 [Saccharopolyspora sp. ASAGF58]
MALVVLDFIDPFFAGLADKTANLAAAAGTSIMMCVTGRRAERDSSLSDLVAGAVAIDGLICVGMHRSNPRQTQAVAEYLPVAVVDKKIDIETDIDTMCGADWSRTWFAIHADEPSPRTQGRRCSAGLHRLV